MGVFRLVYLLGLCFVAGVASELGHKFVKEHPDKLEDLRKRATRVRHFIQKEVRGEPLKDEKGEGKPFWSKQD